jgi:hypothetical protein
MQSASKLALRDLNSGESHVSNWFDLMLIEKTVAMADLANGQMPHGGQASGYVTFNTAPGDPITWSTRRSDHHSNPTSQLFGS